MTASSSSSDNNNSTSSSSSTLLDLANSNGGSNSGNDVETAAWIERLPESFGIREAVRSNKYRWCVRESLMWGIATGTAMTLHRFRMSSRHPLAVNIGTATFLTIYVGSYYFCVKRRNYQEQMIHLMMRLNTFDHIEDMPAQRPIHENHPFVAPMDPTTMTNTTTNANANANNVAVPNKQYVAKLPERKEWQKQLPIQQELSQVFQEVEEFSDKKK